MGDGAVRLDRRSRSRRSCSASMSGFVELQQRLATGAHHESRRRAAIEGHDRRDVVRERRGVGEVPATYAVGADEVRVAEPADRGRPVRFTTGPQVAAGESAEHRHAAGVEPLALQRGEHFLDDVAHQDAPAAYRVGSAMPASANPVLAAGRRRTIRTPHRRPRVVATQCESRSRRRARPRADDVGLGHVDQGSVDAQLLDAFDACLRREARHGFERGDELGATVGVAAVVERVHADEHVARRRAPPRRRARTTGRWCCGPARR